MEPPVAPQCPLQTAFRAGWGGSCACALRRWVAEPVQAIDLGGHEGLARGIPHRRSTCGLLRTQHLSVRRGLDRLCARCAVDISCGKCPHAPPCRDDHVRHQSRRAAPGAHQRLPGRSATGGGAAARSAGFGEGLVRFDRRQSASTCSTRLAEHTATAAGASARGWRLRWCEGLAPGASLLLYTGAACLRCYRRVLGRS